MRKSMKTVLVTGSAGFIGKHVVEALRRRPDTRVVEYDLNTPAGNLELGLGEADLVIHLAGVNRPQSVAEFQAGNAGFTQEICAKLRRLGRTPTIAISSSIQAELENPYGLSKRAAEVALAEWAGSTGARVIVFRLKNVFGKWCHPNYNSVTATFCHNIAHDLPITISDLNGKLELVYIDDVVAAFVGCLDDAVASGYEQRGVEPSYRIALGKLADTVRSFRESRRSLVMPSFEDEFTRRLYATYLSYLDSGEFAYRLEPKADTRGALAEFMKSAQFGQIFVSRTKPGITRGNHYHHTKTEKFLVVEGEAIVRFRSILGGGVSEHPVSGHEFKVVDIPPGYAHSIENVGAGELVTLFWASEIFDPGSPDVYPMEVK
jgi:UDP-2-acetamido-2,6-beta-L-arabino-hexul-4-ose reductase